jgi:hypothetical protein
VDRKATVITWPAKSDPWKFVDRAGTFIAAACALHCAILPIILGTIPSMSLALLSWKDPRHNSAMWLLRLSAWEGAVVASALVFASLSIGVGFARHRRPAAMLLLVLAAVLFGLAIQSSLAAWPWAHAGFAVLGGIALAGAHGLNLRMTSASIFRLGVAKGTHPMTEEREAPAGL